MTVGELLDAIRERYLAQFRQTISEVEKSDMEAWVECAYRDEDGGLAREEALKLPLRLDIVAFADGEAKNKVRVDSKTMLSFEPIDFEWTGIPTRLSPFHWDSCDIRVSGVPRGTDWSRVRNWLDEWFDGEDTRQPDEHGLFGVIHFLSDPKPDGSKTIFNVDFGSAPVEAFEALLDALRDSGATKIEIGHIDGD
jgi:hypothetical protein